MTPRIPLAATYVLAIFAAFFSGVWWLVLLGWAAIVVGACVVADRQVAAHQARAFSAALNPVEAEQVAEVEQLSEECVHCVVDTGGAEHCVCCHSWALYEADGCGVGWNGNEWASVSAEHDQGVHVLDDLADQERARVDDLFFGFASEGRAS